jgi:hypothetical protein
LVRIWKRRVREKKVRESKRVGMTEMVLVMVCVYMLQASWGKVTSTFVQSSTTMSRTPIMGTDTMRMIVKIVTMKERDKTSMMMMQRWMVNRTTSMQRRVSRVVLA